MKRWLLHILLVSVLGMLAASCSQEADDPTLATEGGRVQLKFTIVLDESPASRTWGSHESTTDPNATLAENAVNNMQILLFGEDDDNNTIYCGTLENVQYFSIDPQDKVYEFQGSIPLDADNNLVTTTTTGIDKLNCKIMVLANCSVDLTNLTDIDDVLDKLNDQVFSASSIYDATNGLKAGIPMWGIYTVTDLPVDRNYATNLDDDIYLLRSMAKIEVTLSDITWNNGYRITSATLNKYNAEGYVVPAFKVPVTTNGTTSLTEKALNGFTETTDLSLEGVLREKLGLAYPSEGSTTPSSLGFTATTANRTYVVYVPEMNNTRLNETTDTNGSIWVDLTLAKINSTSTTDYDDITGSVMGGNPRIYLKDYYTTDGNDGLYSPTRNWYYKYTINSISDGIEATLYATPKSWNLVEETWDYSEHVTVETNGHIKWFDADGTQITGEDLGEYMTIVNSLTCKFQLSTPQNATWEASFVSVEGMLLPYLFETSVDNGNGTVTTSKSNTLSGIIKNGEQAVLKIVPARTNIDKNNIAILRIIVTLPSGRSIHVKELTGKSFEEYKIVQYK